MIQFNILNLGAGIQSTTVLLLSRAGLCPPMHAAIFADTGEEPAAVYHHLAWLRSLPGPPSIIVRSKGKLGQDLIAGVSASRRRADGGRFASIPAFTTTTPHHTREGRPATGCEIGILPRQCTKEYKVEVVEQAIRRDIFNLRPRQRLPKNTHVNQFYGISFDERHRATRIIKRLAERAPWSTGHFPLIDMRWTRQHCQDYLKDIVPHHTPRSACVFCPYKSNTEWLHLKQTDPAGWQRAVEIDEAIRNPNSKATRGLDQTLYLHRIALPLAIVPLEQLAAKETAAKETPLFKFCEEGMCGV